MRKMFVLFAILAALTLALGAFFTACSSDDDDSTGDDADDADDDADDDSGDDTSDDTGNDDDLTDDVMDDSGDDDTFPTYECDPPSGLQTTLCNPVYSSTLDYNAGVIGWPVALTVTYDGQLLTGDQLALDCSTYGEYPWPVPLTPYWEGPDSGLINTQFTYPDRQVGPFYENLPYTCKLYAADSGGTTISNQVNISVTLGPKP